MQRVSLAEQIAKKFDDVSCLSSGSIGKLNSHDCSLALLCLDIDLQNHQARFVDLNKNGVQLAKLIKGEMLDDNIASFILDLTTIGISLVDSAAVSGQKRIELLEQYPELFRIIGIKTIEHSLEIMQKMGIRNYQEDVSYILFGEHDWLFPSDLRHFRLKVRKLLKENKSSL